MSIFHHFFGVIFVISLTRAIPLLQNVRISNDITPIAEDTNYRLVEYVKPSHYTIKLRPIIEDNFTFTGESSIKIKFSLAAKTDISLHARDLVIDENYTMLVNANDSIKPIKPKNQVYVNKTDFFTMSFDALEAQEYTLKLKYSGKLHDDLNGFYRSSYINAQGEKVWLATTQFEPTWARRAFPCFDEPSFKATFDISINHDRKLTAASNMPIKMIEPDDVDYDRWWTHFQTTPVMSTYLIAFVVSDFQHLSSNNGKFTVYARPNAKHLGHYALEIGAKALAALDEYTNINYYPYHIDKMDNFAIPQFRAGAMENWGIVTYRESALLFDENVTSTASKQGIATVISHEFAHQWFGNLVSPLWWDYTWLNEGFANYFEYYIADQIEDNWRLMDQFVIKNLQEKAFTADDKEDQHPMNGAVNTPLEISAFFDAITYSKAGCVIRMISHVVNEKVFKKVIRSYLTEMKFKAATSDNLFEELANAALSLKKEYLESWATQRGYPVIVVIRNYETGNASISQHRFLTNKTDEPTESWWVPINYATQGELSFNDTQPSLWLSNEVNKNTTISVNENGWIILNKQQTGYYRVNYDEHNWQLIIGHLISEYYTDIHVLNRAQLLDDAFHMAQAGELSDYSIFLDMSTYLKQEIDYVPWNAAFRAFGALHKALANTKKHDLLKLYILRIIEKLEKTVGYIENKEDDHVTKFNRINAITWACYAGSKNCTSAAVRQLEDYISGSIKISTDLRSVILCSGIRATDVTTWNKTFGIFEKSKDETERKAILAALGCSEDSNILNSYLAKSIIQESQISPIDALKAVLVSSPNGINIAFDFINAKLEEIIKNNKNETVPSVLQILNAIGTRMTTEAQVNKLSEFIKTHKELADILLDKAIVSARNNILWIKKHEPAIGRFLDGQKLVDAPVPSKPSNGPNSSSVIPTLH